MGELGGPAATLALGAPMTDIPVLNGLIFAGLGVVVLLISLSLGFLAGLGPGAAQLNHPNALVVDSKGAVYIADSAGQRVRLISGGAVSTIAGTGAAGYSGSGAAATSAIINNPGGVAVDSSGTVY